MRARRAPLPLAPLLAALLSRTTAASPLLDLHADNFDQVLAKHTFVLVHFYAWGAPAASAMNGDASHHPLPPRR